MVSVSVPDEPNDVDEADQDRRSQPPGVAARRTLKVKLPVGVVLRLHEARIRRGQPIASLLDDILEAYFQAEAAGTPKQAALWWAVRHGSSVCHVVTRETARSALCGLVPLQPWGSVLPVQVEKPAPGSPCEECRRLSLSKLSP